jgi:glycosyltransferase involved in cell wall biosynthesis
MLTLVCEFARRGHRVDLILIRRDGPLLSEVPDAVRIIELGVPKFLASLPALLRLPIAAWRVALHPKNPNLLRSAGRLADYLRKHRPDALLSTLRSENLTAIWGAMLAGTGTRIVVREANTQSIQSASETKPLKRDFPKLSRRWFPRAHRTVAVSDASARDLIDNTGIPANHVSTIYNPVNIDQIHGQAGEALDDPWFVQGAMPVFVTAGRLVAQKDQQTLLRAFSLLRQKRQARLLILGEGDNREALEQLARDLGVEADVRLPGSVANPHKYFARARAFVLSSKWEGFPNVIIEALACGCPVISTDCPGGAAEILADGAFGTLVAVEDPEALSEAMLKISSGAETSVGSPEMNTSTLDAHLDPEQLRRRAASFSVDRAVDAYSLLLLDQTLE